MRQVLNLAMALALAVAAGNATAGCGRCEPIKNVSEQALIVGSGKEPTLEQVREAIVRAGGGLGWRVVDASPGVMLGTLVLRTHTAQVEIPYSTKSFSIVYKASVNLDAADGQIHKNYNGWVQNLARGIMGQAQLL